MNTIDGIEYDFSSVIREELKKQGIKIKELANVLGIADQNLHYKLRTNNFYADNIMDICVILNINPKRFIIKKY